MRQRAGMLGVSALGTLAVLATMAASAGASSQFYTESNPTWERGVNATESVFQFGGPALKCTWGELTGFQEGVSSVLTLHPAYSGCTFNGAAASVSTGNCDYLLSLKTAPGPPFEAYFDVVCAGGLIEIESALCRVTIGEQEASGGTEHVNQGEGSSRDELIEFAVTGIIYEVEGNKLFCGESGENGTYTDYFTLEGFADEALTEQIGIWVE